MYIVLPPNSLFWTRNFLWIGHPWIKNIHEFIYFFFVIRNFHVYIKQEIIWQSLKNCSGQIGPDLVQFTSLNWDKKVSWHYIKNWKWIENSHDPALNFITHPEFLKSMFGVSVILLLAKKIWKFWRR